MQLKWLLSALNNLTDEADFIAQENLSAAREFFNHVMASVEQLSQHPHLGRKGRINGTRELVITRYPYIVPYRIKHNVIVILRVLHTARSWPRRL